MWQVGTWRYAEVDLCCLLCGDSMPAGTRFFYDLEAMAEDGYPVYKTICIVCRCGCTS